MTDEPTTRELERRLDRIDRGIEGLSVEIKTLPTREMFQLYQQATERRLSSAETAATAAEARCSDRRDHLQAEIDQVERARAEDRRMLIKAGITAVVTILAALIGLAGALLPLLL